MKYEEVYLNAYDSVAEARASFDFYNGKRPHSSLGSRTPNQAYFDNLPEAVAA